MLRLPYNSPSKPTISYNPKINTNAYSTEWLRARIDELRRWEGRSSVEPSSRADEIDKIMEALQQRATQAYKAKQA